MASSGVAAGGARLVIRQAADLMPVPTGQLRPVPPRPQ